MLHLLKMKHAPHRNLSPLSALANCCLLYALVRAEGIVLVAVLKGWVFRESRANGGHSARGTAHRAKLLGLSYDQGSNLMTLTK